MADSDKRRPIAERIAGMEVKATFRDIRDGIGLTFGALTDQDIAAALGIVKTRSGKVAVWSLETYYGSSLLHEHRLRAEWADRTESIDDPIPDRIRNRVAAALAIRDFAGQAVPSSLLIEWGHMTLQDPTKLRRDMNTVLSWLEDHRSVGLSELRVAVSDVQAAKKAKKRA